MVPMILPTGGSFCADSTEVTRWQYAAFLTARYPLSEQPLHCAWNDSYVPWYWQEQTRDDLPAVSMDWCDARAYCAWAGKRLCGRVGGGTVSLQQGLDPLRDEWSYACSGGGKHAFPYGDTYVPTACVTNGYDGTPGDQEATDFFRPVKSAPGCVGGFPGLVRPERGTRSSGRTPRIRTRAHRTRCCCAAATSRRGWQTAHV